MDETINPVRPRRRYVMPDCLFLHSTSGGAAEDLLEKMVAAEAAPARNWRRPILAGSFSVNVGPLESRSIYPRPQAIPRLASPAEEPAQRGVDIFA
jgi:hypothetical protein